jgi:hypothetical protein
MTVWEALGLAADPAIEYEVYGVVTTAFDGGKPMKLEGWWAQ